MAPPKYNSCVERANGASRYNYYLLYEGLLTIKVINQGLEGLQLHYNEYRPHDSLDLEALPENYAN